MENKEEIIKKGIEFYQNYGESFLKEIETLHNKIYKLTKFGSYDPSIGNIDSIWGIEDGSVYFHWREDWTFGGHDEGIGDIPIKWLMDNELAEKEAFELEKKIKEMENS